MKRLIIVTATALTAVAVSGFLLPYRVLDVNKYRTISLHLQYLQGSYGTVDMGATMAIIMLSILPVIIAYLFCQKYIIKGVAAGAVKG